MTVIVIETITCSSFVRTIKRFKRRDGGAVFVHSGKCGDAFCPRIKIVVDCLLRLMHAELMKQLTPPKDVELASELHQNQATAQMKQ